jgi:hypothetical protein
MVESFKRYLLAARGASVLQLRARRTLGLRRAAEITLTTLLLIATALTASAQTFEIPNPLPNPCDFGCDKILYVELVQYTIGDKISLRGGMPDRSVPPFPPGRLYIDLLVPVSRERANFYLPDNPQPYIIIHFVNLQAGKTFPDGPTTSSSPLGRLTGTLYAHVESAYHGESANITISQDTRPLCSEAEQVRHFNARKNKEGKIVRRALDVKKLGGSPPSVFFRTGMSTDVDGSPHAFHASNPSLGLDDPENAHGLITRNGKRVVQGQSDPAPGFWVSPTSLVDKTIADTANPRRYVDGETIPFIALPPSLVGAGMVLGDFAAVINPTDGSVHYAIFADIGPSTKIGEGSLALANEMGGGPYSGRNAPEGDFEYIGFPGSGNGKPRTVEEIKTEGLRLFTAWGGDRMADGCFPK